MSERGSTAFVGLGSNLGDRRQHIEAALAELAALPNTRLAARSSIYVSAPVDAGGDDYLNAVARLDTTLDPSALLRALQVIEQRHGRERGQVNAPRTLDLDLLLHGNEERHAPELTLPHPRMHQRAFVLQPLAEIAPGLRIPGHGLVDELQRATAGQRVTRWPTA